MSNCRIAPPPTALLSGDTVRALFPGLSTRLSIHFTNLTEYCRYMHIYFIVICFLFSRCAHSVCCFFFFAHALIFIKFFLKTMPNIIFLIFFNLSSVSPVPRPFNANLSVCVSCATTTLSSSQGLTNSPFRERVGSNRLPEKRPRFLYRIQKNQTHSHTHTHTLLHLHFDLHLYTYVVLRLRNQA